jgi:hypothetical protein
LEVSCARNGKPSSSSGFIAVHATSCWQADGLGLEPYEVQNPKRPNQSCRWPTILVEFTFVRSSTTGVERTMTRYRTDGSWLPNRMTIKIDGWDWLDNWLLVWESWRPNWLSSSSIFIFL